MHLDVMASSGKEPNLLGMLCILDVAADHAISSSCIKSRANIIQIDRICSVKLKMISFKPLMLLVVGKESFNCQR